MKRPEKDKMRKRARAARDTLASDERAYRSLIICDELTSTLVQLPVSATVAVYAAMRSEVDLSAFILAVYDHGCRVAFPCMQRAGTGQAMCMRAVAEQDYRSKTVPFINHPVVAYDANGTFSARYPVVDPADIGLIVVPLVAFDARNNRLGYGGGNYDRYLAQVRPGCRIVGVAFAEQQVDHVPTEPHDRVLPRIISA